MIPPTKTTNDLPQQEVQSVPMKEPTLAERLRVRSNVEYRIRCEAADALDSLQAQLAEAQKCRACGGRGLLDWLTDGETQRRVLKCPACNPFETARLVQRLHDENTKAQKQLAVRDTAKHKTSHEDDPEMAFDDQLGWMHKDSLAIVKPQMELLRDCISFIAYIKRQESKGYLKQLLARAEALGVGKDTTTAHSPSPA